MNKGLALTISSRDRDLGGFSVRRILPYATHRMVGPFIFFDHMGPAHFSPGQGMDVRPHPHINLATVTYLFAGKIHHRDSLGSDQLIEPGAINWMTAGRGIVHSERSPTQARREGGDLHGIQCWVALPRESEEIAPSFTHHPAASLPEWIRDGVQIKLLLGDLEDQKSPVKTYSDIVYADLRFETGGRLRVAAGKRDLALYLVEGELLINGQSIKRQEMAVTHPGDDLDIQASTDARAMLLGGEPLEGKRFIWWNFVSSSAERIERAKADWAAQNFAKIPGDDQEFIPLPNDPPPKGTPL